MLQDSDSVKTTFIRGESELCRAFLFETAIYWANKGKQVYYFTPEPYESMPPSFHDRKEPSANALNNITFIYTLNYEMLANQLVRLPTFQRLPTAILVENLDHFCQACPGRNLEFTGSRCCAVLLNTASTCSRLAGHRVYVCAAATSENTSDERRDNIYEMYFDKLWKISSEVKKDALDIVWMRQTDGVSIEFCWLDDPVLVLKTIYGTAGDKEWWTDG